jgi:hypothetical protein
MLKRGDSTRFTKKSAVFLVVFLVLLITGYFIVKERVVNGSEEGILGKYTLDLEISHAQIRENNSLVVMVKRNLGRGEFVGINFRIYDGNNTEVIRTNYTLEQLESKIFLLNLALVNASKVKKISIDPVFRLSSKEEVLGNIKDRFVFGSSDLEFSGCLVYCPSYAECGDDGCGAECGGGCTQEGYICLNSKCILSLETKCSRTNVTVKKVNNTGTNFSVVLSRHKGEEEIGGVKLIFSDETGFYTFIISVEENMTSHKDVTEYITILNEQLRSPKRVQPIVYFIDESGVEQFCKPSIQFSF